MNAIELKSGINTFVETIEDQNILENIYNYAMFFCAKQGDTDVLEQLTESQYNRLMSSLTQIDNKQTIPHKLLKKEAYQW